MPAMPTARGMRSAWPKKNSSTRWVREHPATTSAHAMVASFASPIALDFATACSPVRHEALLGARFIWYLTVPKRHATVPHGTNHATRTKSSSALQAPSDPRRDSILDAAFTVMMERGYDRTSTLDIASAAKVFETRAVRAFR